MSARMKVTLNVYNCVKILTTGGASVKEIAEYMKIGESTVSRIRMADSYEEYKLMAQNAYLGYKKQKQEKEKPEGKEQPKEDKPTEPPVQVVEHRQTVTVQATHYMMEEMKKTNELLTLISNKLTFIVEQLA